LAYTLKEDDDDDDDDDDEDDSVYKGEPLHGVENRVVQPLTGCKLTSFTHI